MSESRRIHFEDLGLYLITHDYGSTLHRILRNSIRRAFQVWDRPSYIAKVIFSDMIHNHEKEIYGFEITTKNNIIPDFRDITINTKEKTVKLRKKAYSFEKYSVLSLPKHDYTKPKQNQTKEQKEQNKESEFQQFNELFEAWDNGLIEEPSTTIKTIIF